MMWIFLALFAPLRKIMGYAMFLAFILFVIFMAGGLWGVANFECPKSVGHTCNSKEMVRK